MTEALSLSDRLAVERTRLANERTLLAYVRTAFAFLAGALTLAHLFETPEASASAAVLTAAGVVLLGLGALRYRAAGRLLREAMRPEATASSDA